MWTKQPSQVPCVSEDQKCCGAWDTTCVHKANDMTLSVAWRRRAWKEERWEKGPSSSTIVNHCQGPSSIIVKDYRNHCQGPSSIIVKDHRQSSSRAIVNHCQRPSSITVNDHRQSSSRTIVNNCQRPSSFTVKDHRQSSSRAIVNHRQGPSSITAKGHRQSLSKTIVNHCQGPSSIIAKNHRQSDRHWNRFKGDVMGNYARRGGTHNICFSKRTDTILKWTEPNETVS